MRRLCVTALVLLIAQYGMGMFVNFYVAVPASDAHAGFIQEVKTAPPALTVHALLGLALIGTAVVLLAKAVRAREGVIVSLAVLGLGAIGGAFAAGEMFVKNGEDSLSFAMAVLTGVALLCYVAALAAASATRFMSRPLSAAPQADGADGPARSTLPQRPMQPRPIQARPIQARPMPQRPLPPRPVPVRPAGATAPPWPGVSQPPSWFAREQRG